MSYTELSHLKKEQKKSAMKHRQICIGVYAWKAYFDDLIWPFFVFVSRSYNCSDSLLAPY